MPQDATPPAVDEELYGVDGMHFTRHAQDGDHQVDGSRLTPYAVPADRDEG
jgi:hypothetical protein